VFRCAGEDAWCAIAVETDAEWLALAATIGRQDLAARADLRTAAGRMAAMAEVEAAVTAWTRARGAVEAAGILQNAGVPAARVSSARDLVEEDPQLAARDYWQTLDHPEMGPSLFTSPPFTIDGERVELRRPPLFGEHTQEVLSGLLGISDAEIAALAERKVLA
ncbi:MAG: CoA transferase, partial [Rhodospirillales bacterium]|nr:CoA transferase [Rhodospirillales bacterium]